MPIEARHGLLLLLCPTFLVERRQQQSLVAVPLPVDHQTAGVVQLVFLTVLEEVQRNVLGGGPCSIRKMLELAAVDRLFEGLFRAACAKRQRQKNR